MDFLCSLLSYAGCFDATAGDWSYSKITREQGLMWKINLCTNILVLLLLWLLSQVAVTPSHNLLVQYAEAGVSLPILTDFAFRIQRLTAIIPLLWIVFTFILGSKLQKQTAEKRNGWLSLHSSVSLCIGFLLVIFFSIAGILPFIKFNTFIN